MAIVARPWEISDKEDASRAHYVRIVRDPRLIEIFLPLETQTRILQWIGTKSSNLEKLSCSF